MGGGAETNYFIHSTDRPLASKEFTTALKYLLFFNMTYVFKAHREQENLSNFECKRYS